MSWGGNEEGNTVLFVSIRVLNTDLCTSRTTKSKRLYEVRSGNEGSTGVWRKDEIIPALQNPTAAPSCSPQA